MQYLLRLLVGIVALPIAFTLAFVGIVLIICAIPFLWLLIIIWWVHDFGKGVIGFIKE
jgi:hypothetical protein